MENSARWRKLLWLLISTYRYVSTIGLTLFTVRLNVLPRASLRVSVFIVRVYMHTYSVEEMRDLLLEYGATNTKRCQQDWIIFKARMECEPIILKILHEDPRVSY